MTVIAIKRHPGIDADALAVVLQEQLAEVAAAWNVLTTTRVVAYSFRKPKGAWRMQFYSTLPPGMGGVHLSTSTGLPYAKILLSEGSVAASHEACEMLVDPLGERFLRVSGRDYLVEVCDPCEAITYRASNGVALSDFITPDWYTFAAASADRQKQVAGLSLFPGGYVSWVEGGHWWQRFLDRNGLGHVRDLGPAVTGTRTEKNALAAR
jgi:hypothetical protein